MKEIILRQAQLKGYDTYLHITTLHNSSLVYGYPNEEDNPNLWKKPNEKQEIIEAYLKSHKPHIPVDLYGEYRENINNIFFIIVDGVYSGYVFLKKEKKKIVRIVDLCIINHAIIREIYLFRIFSEIFKITDADEMYILCCSEFLRKMALMIGFESLDRGIRLQKKRRR